MVREEKAKRETADLPAGPVYLFPTLQFPLCDVLEDEKCFLALLKTLQEEGLSKLRLATGYLNLMKPVERALDSSKMPTEVLMSSPKANSFYQAGRVKSKIPAMYRVNAIRMLNRNKARNLKLFEYTNNAWTYHAKGAWVYEDEADPYPQMSIIGSSNFSYRSNRRDQEVQLYMAPSAKAVEFKRRLHNEANGLF
jgi:phosphatidylserine/phosphatidylglycerophosphate/cardiolipin synthase-like enzyme